MGSSSWKGMINGGGCGKVESEIIAANQDIIYE
jgi:hypothetical protein